MRIYQTVLISCCFVLCFTLALLAPVSAASVWEDVARFGMGQGDSSQADRLAQRLLQHPGTLEKKLRQGMRLPAPVLSPLLSRVRFGILQENKKEWQSLLEQLQQAPPMVPLLSAQPSPARAKTEVSAITLSPATWKTMVEVSPDRNTLIFRVAGGRGANDLSGLKAGCLLISGPTADFPDGFARRVTRAAAAGNRLQVETIPLSLEELLSGDAGLTSSLQPQDIESASLETGPNERLPGFSPTADDAEPGRGSLEPVSAAGNESLWRLPRRETAGNLWEQVKKSAVFSTGLSLEFRNAGLGATLGIKILNPELVVRKDELSFRGNLVLDTALGLRPAESLAFKHALVTLKLKPIPLGFCGPVPIWIRPKIRLILKGRVSGDIGCEGTFSCEAPLFACLRRTDGHWRNDSTATISGRTPGLRLNGSLGQIGAKLFVGTSLTLAINDLAGPTLRSGVYLSFGAVSTLIRSAHGMLPKPLLTLLKVKGGAEIAVGGALEFLKHAEFLATIFRVEVPLYKLKYAGIELDPTHLSLATDSFDPAKVSIWPIYRQRLLEEDRGTIRLTSLSGRSGTWTSPSRSDGMIPVTVTGAGSSSASSKTPTAISCSLPLVDGDLSGRNASLTISIEDPKITHGH